MTGYRGTPVPPRPQGGVERHGAAIFEDAAHDPYQARGKYAEPSRCGECGAVFHRGRWQWGSAPEGARNVVCPACHRIRDGLPAGTLTLEGPYVEVHRDDIAHLVRNVEAREKADHPLHRLVDVAHAPGSITVTTADIHLAQRIGEAVKHAHRGALEIEYAKGEYSVRARWRR
jgi:hypothetical protein